MYARYEHHGKMVTVRADLKNRHRDFCLCFHCTRFDSTNRDHNCEIANDTYANCVKHGIATPVWECPMFVDADAARRTG